MNKKIVGLLVGMLVLATVIPIVGTTNTDNLATKVKWRQLPDTSKNGIDIRIDRNDGIPRKIADDFECTSTGPITDIHFWGSWKNDEKGEIRTIHLSIHKEIPANESPTNYSMPGELLWEKDIHVFEESMYAEVEGEWWWDPYRGILIPDNDHEIWRYDIFIDEDDAFVQEGTADHPVVYWLDLWVKTEEGEFGWKTAKKQWNDDAVYHLDDDPYWFELTYPDEHPYHSESLDMAFAITTIAEEEECCFEVSMPRRMRFGRIGAYITETCNISHTNVPWKMEVTGGLWWPMAPATFNDTISAIAAFDTVYITSDFVCGFGPLEIKIKVDDCDPVTFNAFIVLFWIFLVP